MDTRKLYVRPYRSRPLIPSRLALLPCTLCLSVCFSLTYSRPDRRLLLQEAENTEALGALDLVGVKDGDVLQLPKHAFTGKRGMSVEVFHAPHKDMPSVSYGLFRVGKRLKPEYADQQHRIGELMKANPGLEVKEDFKERTLFYSGDTTIELLEKRAPEILEYRYVIHECTFLGPPSAELDEYAGARGHTHYAQLHKFICSAPDTIFVLVHWSIRYSREDVHHFFDEQYGGVPRNVVLWI